MDKALIVQVLVPVKGEGGKKGYRCGTGCAVGEGQILTARHVVSPEEGRDPKRPIRVLWYHYDKANNAPARYGNLPEAEIRWEGRGDLDAALLACERHPASAEIPSWPLAETMPPALARWESRGFPYFAQTGAREHYDPHGDILSPAKTDRELTLSQSEESWARTPGTAAKDWSCASGMPVLADGRIFGVVKEVLPDSRPPQLLAVPTALLLADEGFRAAYRPPAPPDGVALARDFITGVLESSGEAAGRFAKTLSIGTADPPGRRREIAEALVAMPLTAALDKALAVQAELLKAGEGKAAAAVARLVQAFLPLKHGEKAALERVCAQREAALIAMPCRSETVAEILMAGAQRRAARFARMRREDDFPPGYGRLARPPECGRDPKHETLTKDIRRELAETLESCAPETMQITFAEYLGVEFVPDPTWLVPPPGATKDELKRHLEEIDEFIRDKLEDRWARERLAYYYILHLPPASGGGGDSRLLEALESLKRRFPRLSFLVLERGMPARELKPYHPLLPLLYAAQENSP